MALVIIYSPPVIGFKEALNTLNTPVVATPRPAPIKPNPNPNPHGRPDPGHRYEVDELPSGSY